MRTAFLTYQENALSINSSQCAGQKRSTLALSKIITHNSRYPRGIRNITLAKTHLSRVALTSILYSVGATAHALSFVQYPPQGFLTRHLLSYIIFKGTTHALSCIQFPGTAHALLHPAPNITQEETTHTIFVPNSHPQGLANRLALSYP